MTCVFITWCQVSTKSGPAGQIAPLRTVKNFKSNSDIKGPNTPTCLVRCALGKEVTVCSLHLGNEEQCSITLRVDYLHELFGVFCTENFYLFHCFYQYGLGMLLLYLVLQCDFILLKLSQCWALGADHLTFVFFYWRAYFLQCFWVVVVLFCF